MSNKCKVCDHYYRKEIDIRLLNKDKIGETFASIARNYEGISESAIKRHYYHHLGKPGYSPDSSGSSDPDIDLSTVIEDAEIDSWQCYKDAMTAGDVKFAQSSLSNALRCYEIRRRDEEAGKAKGSVKVEDSPEFQTLLTRILTILDKFPDAKAEVAKCFRPN